MASRKLVLPCPFSPTIAMPSRGTTTSTRSRLRKSRMASSAAYVRASGRCGASGTDTTDTLFARELRVTLGKERRRSLGHVFRGAERTEQPGLECQCVIGQAVEAAVDGLDGAGHGQRTVLRHLQRDGQ